jgi:ketosteroid isomerase-like protein
MGQTATKHQPTKESARVTARFTPRQGAYLSFIQHYAKLHGRSPSEAEMQQFFMVSPPSVHQMVMTLEKRGLVARRPGIARSLRVLVTADQLPFLDDVRADMGFAADGQNSAGKSPIAVALAFIARINACDVAGLCDLMTEEHVFVEALGGRFEGRENMRVGWKEFFRLFPGYRIQIEATTAAGETVGLFGTAKGSYRDAPKKRWRVAAAWQAVISDGLVAEWRVYCDTAWTRLER